MRPKCSLIAAVVTAAVAVSVGAPTAGATVLPTGFQEDAVATGFSGPTAMAFAPDGRKFVVEKAGRVRVAKPDGTVAVLLDIRDRVNSYSDRGMLGVATDKDFATNGYLYLLYVYELQPLNPDSDAPMVSRLTRVTVKSDSTLVNPSAPETTILGTDVSSPCPAPDNVRDCIPADFYWHTIGTVRSDPVDGTLWVGTGDTHRHAIDGDSYRPLDERTFAGKLLHIDRDGRGLASHPFCPTDADLTHVCTKLYAKGFRNPFRFTLRPNQGPVVGDVGANDREEIDLLKPGKSYGWPCYEGDVRTPLYDQETRCQQEYTKEGTATAHVAPNWSYPHGAGASIIAGPVYSGTGYPAEFRGDVFVGDYVQGWVKRLKFDANEKLTSVIDFATSWPTAVELQAMPGAGDVGYVDLGYGGTTPALRSVRYTGSLNGPPVARSTATPTSGTAPLLVQFDGTGSTDPDGDALTYDWDFGDATAHATTAKPSHSYAANGAYTARLTVADGRGHTASTTLPVTVGNRAPTATITAPAATALYQGGKPVALQGSGTDPEDGTLTGTSLSWVVRVFHGTHIHALSTATGPTASFTPLVDHDADAYYDISLTATDSGGLVSTKTIQVRPQTSRLTLASTPQGAPIAYAGQVAAAAPFTRTAGVGFRASVSAADTFTSGGGTYKFQSWSDGGARQHEVSVPATDTTLTANYVPTTSPGVDTFVFTPEADTWVDSSQPSTSFGTWSSVRVDRSPQSQAFMRFRLTGLAGRKVVGAKLRLAQRDASPVGGRVFAMSSSAWSESMTWSTKPAIDGRLLASFGAVETGRSYEADLGAAAIPGDGPLPLALDSPDDDGSVWSTRESTGGQPQLVVQVERVPGLVRDGLSEVANPFAGSYNPTYYAGNRRLARTAGGRLLALHGRVDTGVQLAWRDAGGGWQTQTTGATDEGLILSGAGNGDWPASIATAKDAAGVEHAWVVWSGPSTGAAAAVKMVRLDDLDAVTGPKVGATSTVDAPALGAYRADVAFERASDGTMKGALVWTRRTGDASWAIVAGWFTDLASSTPAIEGVTTLYTTTSSSDRFATLVPAPSGMRVLTRSTSSSLRVWSHGQSAPLTTWTSGGSGMPTSGGASLTGVALDNGEMVAAADVEPSGTVQVQRFSAAGAPGSVELTLTGYEHPTLATNGTDVWLVAVRRSDGLIISRTLTSAGWSTSDRVEVGAAGGGNHAWPNALRTTDGRLRFIVRGPAGTTSRSGVLAFQRPL